MGDVVTSSRMVEKAVLGCAIVSQDARDYVVSKLSPDHFAVSSHRIIFNAIADAAGELDEVILIERLKTLGVVEEIGGSGIVFNLTSSIPAVSNYKAYAESVIEHYGRRSISLLADEMSSLAADDTDSDALLEKIAAEAAQIRAKTSVGRKAVGQSITEVAQLYESEVVTEGIPFPFSDLNLINRGQHPGNIIITTGWSGHGKTWWLLQCAEEAAGLGHKVGFVTLEMPKIELYQRLLLQDPYVTQKDVHDRVVNESTTRRREAIHRLNITVFDWTDGLGTPEGCLREIARAEAEGQPYSYFIIDHMHLMDLTPDGKSDYRLAFGDAMRKMKRGAVQHKLVMHFGAQLRRADRGGKVRFPVFTMQDLREASHIENIADFIGGPWRETDGESHHPLNTGKFLIVKVRGGTHPEPIPVIWQEDRCRFTPSSRFFTPAVHAYS